MRLQLVLRSRSWTSFIIGKEQHATEVSIRAGCTKGQAGLRRHFRAPDTAMIEAFTLGHQRMQNMFKESALTDSTQREAIKDSYWITAPRFGGAF
jgi:hypothetical protein